MALFVAGQIAFEQTLSNSRMTWNLTFQGFAIAGYALVATADTSEPAKIVIQALISLSAVVIAAVTLLGLLASEQQRDRLRHFWEKSSVLSEQFPAPFSEHTPSKHGRLGPRLICVTLICMWVALVILGLPFSTPTAG